MPPLYLFDLFVTAQAIREAEDGYECNKLAMRIQKPHPDWTNKKEAIMKTVLTAKFTQNEHLRQYLLETGDASLHEATRDRWWACGVGLHSHDIQNQTYTGQDRLG